MIGSQAALEKLLAGNKRFVSNQSEHPNMTQEARKEAAFVQKPFAVVFGCSDSRVPLEIVFDQGIGDLFVVRNAGSVLDEVALESIKFGSLILGAQLIFVLGHENCGAVGAVLENKTEDMPTIAAKISGALKKEKDPIIENVHFVVDTLKHDRQIAKHQIALQGGYFELASGIVRLI